MPVPTPRGNPRRLLVALLLTALVGALAGCLAGEAAAPEAGEEDVAPPRVLLVGDSLTFMGATALQAAFRERGIEPELHAIPGSGLLEAGPQVYDWMSVLTDLVDDLDPDLVVAEFAGNYGEPYATGADGRPVLPDGDAFLEAWAEATDEAIERLGAGGARVAWVLAPPTRLGVPSLDARYAAVRRLYEERIARRWPDVQLVDWAVPLTEDGAYAETLPGEDGRPVAVRDDDGLHLTEEGSRRVAEHTVEQVL